MAAGIVAAELGLPMFRVNLARVLSKWVGGTEKNLDNVFTAAEDSNAILFLDEADALLGKRSEVRDSHDRYANIEISYLLQKMELYEGVAILATNMPHLIDEAFARRMTFTVYFPMPDEAERERIWRRIWPKGAPRGDDINFDRLAKMRLTGGNIKNVLLAAASLAAADRSAITTAHIRHALRREYQKFGKELNAAKLDL
jgi:SpoVK/Ycf46/Vps4 family AAA+-type ATPase